MMPVLSIKKIRIFLVVCLVVFLYYPIFSESRSITLGGNNGWTELAVSDGIVTGTGRFGYACLQLASDVPPVTETTDLLLHFDRDDMQDSAGHYDILKNSLVKTDKTVFGKYAALSPGVGNGMLLKGKKNSMFGTSGRLGSFLIDFWLAPSIAENGETVFSWRSSRNVDEYPVYQMITVSFFNNHLEWKFSNVFDGYMKNDGEITLEGQQTVIPDVWTHHSLSFDEDTGLLEYSVNGAVEALQYITATGHERGTVCQPILGVPANIELCPQYTGRIDEFRITAGDNFDNVRSQSDSAEAFYHDVYKRSGGRFESQPLSASPGAVLNSVGTVMDVPPQTDVCLYVRGGDNYFGWTDTSPGWVSVKDGKPVSPVIGRYFQVAGDLFPDGGGKKSPSVTRISLNYTEQSLPLPPFTIKAVPGDKTVTLTWNYSVDDSAGGYYVYYGERPGEYLGRAAAEGPSPINVGNTASVLLTGLKNGTIYYFAIASWSRFDKQSIGKLSREVYARPYGERHD